MTTANPHPATLVSVSGMLQVVPPRPPSPTQLLTQKQVRELRRLCRKTANRAEFDFRPIQIRQIASIAAMASPSFLYFDPQNPNSGASLRKWVEFHRAHGAEWKDERPLLQDAIDELRSWDLLLKAWATIRFDAPLSGSPKVERKAANPAPVSSSPVTPYRTHSHALNVNEVMEVKEDKFGPVGSVQEAPIALNGSPLPTTPVKASPRVARAPPIAMSPSPHRVAEASLLSRNKNADAVKAVYKERVTGGALLGVSSPIRAAGPYEGGLGMIGDGANSVTGLGGGLARTPVKRNEGKPDLAPIGTPVRKSGKKGTCVHGAIGGPVRASSNQVLPGQATVGMASEERRGAEQGNQGVSPMATPAITPIKDTYASKVARGLRQGQGGAMKMGGSPGSLNTMAEGRASGLNRRASEIGIVREGDTINITVPTELMSNMRAQEGSVSDVSARYVAREDQENVYPPLMKRASYLHAVNTAKSWRKDIGDKGRNQYGMPGEKVTVFRNAAKNLVSNSAKASVGAPGFDVPKRADMDWGTLRRPALRIMPVNNSQNRHSLAKNSQ